MLAVIAMHSGLLPMGWIGVWVFYVISGYVVTASLKRHPATSAGSWLKIFYLRRAARIIPIYAIYVGVVCAVAWIATGRSPLPEWLALTLFYYNFAMILNFGDVPWLIVGHLWSVSVEMQFYLVFGLLFVFLPKRLLVATLIAFVLLSPVARAVAGHWIPRFFTNDLGAFAIYGASFLHFDAFGAGALLALGWPMLSRIKHGAAKLFAIGACVLGAYLVAYAAVNAFWLHRQGIDVVKDLVSGVLYGQGREIWLYSALAAINVGIVAWTASGRSPWGFITRVRFLQWIGEVSYGAYIFHAAAILLATAIVAQFVGDNISVPWRLVVFTLASGLSIGAAALSSRYIERPAVRWMNRKLQTAPVEETAKPAEEPSGGVFAESAPISAPMTHAFVKMNGAGNEFIIVMALASPFNPTGDQVRALSDRAAGEGFDQLIAIERSDVADAFMRVWNADGTSVETCGNALRCVGWILMEANGSDRVVIDTLGGTTVATRAGDHLVTVDMGEPRLDWGQIPLAEEMDTRNIELQVGPIDAPHLHTPGAVSMGNPHVVFLTDQQDDAFVSSSGSLIERHPLFPEGVNVGFANVLAPDRIRLRVWERGAGLTKACGTGACAALVTTFRRGLTGRKAVVVVDGGELVIDWDEVRNHVFMTGPVEVERTGTLAI